MQEFVFNSRITTSYILVRGFGVLVFHRNDGLQYRLLRGYAPRNDALTEMPARTIWDKETHKAMKKTVQKQNLNAKQTEKVK